ncbi:MAG: hypothetical protein OXH96_00355 [Spirochaetaceae bacterium]|nr:hypothetical protein [Spirochaetaceae bacterium]
MFRIVSVLVVLTAIAAACELTPAEPTEPAPKAQDQRKAPDQAAEPTPRTGDPAPAPTVTLSHQDVVVPEGSAVGYTVKLDAQPSGAVTVTATVSGSEDVAVSPESLEFTAANWATEQTLSVSAVHDEDGEYDSATISLAATGGGYDAVTIRSVGVTVNDDEHAGSVPPPSSATPPQSATPPASPRRYTHPVHVEFDPANSIREGEQSHATFRIEIGWTIGNREEGTAVSYRTVDGTARAGTDYTATSGRVTFALGEVKKTLSVAILDDTEYEEYEEFSVHLHSGVGVSYDNTDYRHTMSITDNDAPPSATTPHADGYFDPQVAVNAQYFAVCEYNPRTDRMHPFEYVEFQFSKHAQADDKPFNPALKTTIAFTTGRWFQHDANGDNDYDDPGDFDRFIWGSMRHPDDVQVRGRPGFCTMTGTTSPLYECRNGGGYDGSTGTGSNESMAVLVVKDPPAQGKMGVRLRAHAHYLIGSPAEALVPAHVGVAANSGTQKGPHGCVRDNPPGDD